VHVQCTGNSSKIQPQQSCWYNVHAQDYGSLVKPSKCVHTAEVI